MEIISKKLKYETISDTEVQVIGCSSDDITELEIPAEVTSSKGVTYKVTKIEGNAFDTWSYSLTSVIIPDSVIVIGGYAFNRCTTLTSVTIPESVTSIGVFAFCRCTGLTSVTIPNRVTEIGSGAFDGCTGLTSVTIPNRVTKISGAFEGCTGLTSVIAPKGLDCDSAFEKCSSLANITFVDSVSPADQESEEAYVIDPEEEEEDKKESDADDDAYNADDDLGRDISKPLDKKLTRICIDVRKNGNLSFFLEDTRFKLIKVQGGTFKMGVQDDDESAPNYSENAYTDDSTVHDVTLSDFYIGQVPVTIGIWQKVMGYRSSFSESYEKRKEAFCDEDDLDVFGSIYNRPIDGVNWYDCLNFCNRLSIYFGLKPYYNIEIVKLKKWNGKNAPFIQSIENANVSFNDDANGFRLPTEAQWEFAARGGIKTSHFYDYSGSNDIEKVAVYDSCFDCPADVAQLAPNILGLYDMSGNVSEWCQDDYLPYTANPATDPLVLDKDCEKVIRGGSWCSYDNTYCMSTVRCSHDPSSFGDIDNRLFSGGLRLALKQPVAAGVVVADDASDCLLSPVSQQDHSQYIYNGASYGKGRLVLAVIKDYVEAHPEVTFASLKEVFPDKLQGTCIFSTLDEALAKVENDPAHKRNFIGEGETIQLKDAVIAVSNQWGIANIGNFIDCCKWHNIKISITSK